MASFSDIATRPAAQYIRVSTDHQHCSVAIQKSVIANYARARAFSIVRTYTDIAKSGLSLKGRDGLRQLLADALDAEREFDAILVHDISRWGRFQDPDQAGHYEYLCRQAGVTVHYCAEPFENDFSPMAGIWKSLKRVMAHEFSRELSEKISRATRQQARLGHKQGGSIIYGFHRQVFDAAGHPRFGLEPHQRKALRTDRVRFVPGTAAEQEVIRAIFRLFVQEGQSLIRIATLLREASIPGTDGRPWSSQMVRSVLTSELCLGSYVYNKTSAKLQRRRSKNPDHQWTRADGLFAPIISGELFDQAQARIAARAPGHIRPETLLDDLRALYQAKGRLSKSLIDRTAGISPSATYRAHFGNMTNAYKCVGYEPPFCLSGADRAWTKAELGQALRRLHKKHGYLSSALLDGAVDLPSYSAFRKHFGSMARLCAFAGVPSQTRRQAIKAGQQRRSERLKLVPEPPFKRKAHFTDAQMVAGLKRLQTQHGYLSVGLIKNDPHLPSSTTIIERFGSIRAAYRAAGWIDDRSLLATLSLYRRYKAQGR